MKLIEWDIFARLSHFAKVETRKCKKKTRSLPCSQKSVCVCACKPSIAKRALLRLKSSTRSTSSNADSMMRTAATSVWAVSLLLLLLLLEDCCADISFRKQRLPQLIKVICGWSWPAEGDACGCGEEKVLEASTT